MCFSNKQGFFKAGMMFGIFLESSMSMASAGKVIAVKGEVQVESRPVQVGMVIRPGWEIRTGEESSATLVIGEGTVIYLAEKSDFKVDRYDSGSKAKGEEADFHLKKGKTRAVIRNNGKKKKNFRFKTKNATMGVRGTHIAIDGGTGEGDSSPPTMTVIEGSADVVFQGSAGRPAQSISLGANQTLDLEQSKGENNAPAEQRTLPPGGARKVADAIAPPPPVFESPDDLDFTDNGPPPPPDWGPPSLDYTEGFDPTLDGGGEVRVKITGRVF